MFIKQIMSNLHQRAKAILKQFYGYDDFYPVQWEIIQHALNGKDSLVLMPTGGGKSLCYQIPALMSEGCAIVVSPLLALMNDQVEQLIVNNIPAAAINSQQSDETNRTIMEHVFSGRIKLLYISPEKLLKEMSMWSRDLNISLIAIDEAHCISQWGHDFRPDYTALKPLKQRFPKVPFMALTATADELTRNDICVQLNMTEAKKFITSFDRPNIHLSVSNTSGKAQKIKELVNFLQRHPDEAGIVYCLTRKAAEDLASVLSTKHFKASAFHAGMPSEAKSWVHRAFLNDEINIVCATVAFGMGINKSNVRWVVHYNMPGSIEEYYQEIGRAGRDGMPAEALLFYSYADVISHNHFAQEAGQSLVKIEKLNRMQHYAESTICRRRILLNYFNEPALNDCHHCDVCENPPQRFDGTTYCQMALSALVRTKEQVGLNMLVDILRGSRKASLAEAGYHLLPTFGVGRMLSFSEWQTYVLQMVQMGIIEINYSDFNHLKMTKFGRDVLLGKQTVELSKFERKTLERCKPEKFKVQDEQTEAHPTLMIMLKDKRRVLAAIQKVPPYVIFSDKVLTAIAIRQPVTEEEFGNISGVGEYKKQRYWRAFTNVVLRWKENR